MKTEQTGRDRRPSTWRRLAIAGLAGCGAVCTVVAQPQPRDPASQYVEWPVAGEGLECPAIAVSPEFDGLVRRHETKGVTTLFVQVADDGKVSGTRQVVASGFARENMSLDVLARDRLVRCRAQPGVSSLYVDVLWDFRSGRSVGIQARSAEVRDFQRASHDPARCKAPTYPPESLLRKESGTVRLMLLVDATGVVTDVTVAKSSGHEALDVAASSALSACLFRPATVKGEAVRGMVFLEYVWRL